MSSNSKAIRCIGSALLWASLTTAMGLLQLWLNLASEALQPPGAKMTVTFASILSEGALLFFSMTLVATLASDIVFSDRDKLQKPVLFIFFFLVPVFAAIFVTWAYMLILFSHLDFTVLQALQYSAGSFAVIYAVAVKTYQFFLVGDPKR